MIRLRTRRQELLFGICLSLRLQVARSHKLVAITTSGETEWHFRHPEQLLSQAWSPKLTKVSHIIATVREYHDLHDLEPEQFIDSQLWRTKSTIKELLAHGPSTCFLF